MLASLVRNRWLIGLRGVLAIIFGIIAIVSPQITLIALIYVFAAYALIDGILTIAWSVRNRDLNDRWWLGLLEGIVDIAAGIIAVFFPTLAALTLLFVIAIWAIITGLLEIAAAIRLRAEIENEWAMGLAGAASVILGIVLILNPGPGLVGLVWIIAIWAIIFGILMIALAFRLNKVANTGGGSKIYSQ